MLAHRIKAPTPELEGNLFLNGSWSLFLGCLRRQRAFGAAEEKRTAEPAVLCIKKALYCTQFSLPYR